VEWGGRWILGQKGDRVRVNKRKWSRKGKWPWFREAIPSGGHHRIKERKIITHHRWKKQAHPLWALWGWKVNGGERSRPCVIDGGRGLQGGRSNREVYAKFCS